MTSVIAVSGFETSNQISDLVHKNKSASLGSNALKEFLRRFVEGNLDSTSLQEIANLLESESVEYEVGAEGEIAQILFELSAPEINQPISVSRCQAFMSRLER